MSIKYECCYCRKTFPADKQVDGFSQGYKEGFLCPHCGKNIKDNIYEAKQRLNSCQLLGLIVVALLYLPVFIASFIEKYFQIAGYEVSLHSIAFGIYVVAALMIVIIVPCTRKAGVIITEPVDEK